MSVVKIRVSSTQFALVDADNAEALLGLSWSLNGSGYAETRRRIGSGRRLRVMMHRVICSAEPGEIIDHVNGDRLDNRRANLRRADYCTNGFNLHSLTSRNTSGMRGVQWRKDRLLWQARITYRGKTHILGNFRDQQDAIAARQKAELRFHAELAPTWAGSSEAVGAGAPEVTR